MPRFDPGGKHPLAEERLHVNCPIQTGYGWLGATADRDVAIGRRLWIPDCVIAARSTHIGMDAVRWTGGSFAGGVMNAAPGCGFVDWIHRAPHTISVQRLSICKR